MITELDLMISFSQLSRIFGGISFALLSCFSVVTFSLKSEGYGLLNRRDAEDAKKDVKENFRLYHLKLDIS